MDNKIKLYVKMLTIIFLGLKGFPATRPGERIIGPRGAPGVPGFSGSSGNPGIPGKYIKYNIIWNF